MTNTDASTPTTDGPVYTYLDASTSHITEGDGANLTDGFAGGLVCYPNAYGAYIPLGYVRDDGGLDAWLAERDPAEVATMSADFWALIRHALGLGCNLLCLDGDAPVVDGLPTHDW